MTLTEIQQRARKALVSLVAQSGGVSGKAQIQQDQIPLLKELFTERFVERSQWHDDGAIVRVDGWHAFDELVPLEDPNRWDRLRAEVYKSLEADGWVRTQPPRGSEFIIPHAFLPVADSTITILTWNPDHWGGDQWWTDEVANFDPQDPTSDRWSTGSRSSGIAIGDYGILLRQKHERGIVGIGIFTSEIYQDEHWDESGRAANYAEIEWLEIVPLEERIPTEELLDLIPEVKWNNLYGSGVQVEDDPADELYELICDRWDLGNEPPLLPDPDEELAKATSSRTWLRSMLTILLAGQRPKASEGTRLVTEIGHQLLRSLDQLAFQSTRPDRPEFFDNHFAFDVDDSEQGGPDLCVAWPDRVLLLRLLPEPGSDQDPASSSLEPFRQRFAGCDIDIITIANQRESHRTQPTGIRSASLAWDQLTSELTELGPMLPEAEQSWLDRFVALTSEVTGSEPAG